MTVVFTLNNTWKLKHTEALWIPFENIWQSRKSIYYRRPCKKIPRAKLRSASRAACVQGKERADARSLLSPSSTEAGQWNKSCLHSKPWDNTAWGVQLGLCVYCKDKNGWTRNRFSEIHVIEVDHPLSFITSTMLFKIVEPWALRLPLWSCLL